MAFPDERSIFDEIFLPPKRNRGRKFVVGTVAGIGVATALVVGALAAGGGSGTPAGGAQPSTAGLALGSGSPPGGSSSNRALIETTTPVPTSTVVILDALSSPTAVTGEAPPTATSTATPRATAAPPTATPVPATSGPPSTGPSSSTSVPVQPEPSVQQQASLAAAPTSTTSAQTLVQQATSTPTLTPSPTQTPTPTRTPSPTATVTKATLPPATGLNAFERDMFNLHNEARSDEGVRTLNVDADAVAIARFRAQEMLDDDQLTHYPGSGNTAAKLLSESDATYTTYAENIAYNSGYGSASTVEVAMNGLLGSPGHYQNIMNPRYSRVGVGVASTGNTFYYAIIFLGP